MTPDQITTAANDIKQVSNSILSAYNRVVQLINYNNVNDPGWSSLTGAAVDANGFIVGTSLKPLDISNAIAALNNLKGYWEGAGVSAIAWGQNLEKICDPLV